jgi:hypothetical protein
MKLIECNVGSGSQESGLRTSGAAGSQGIAGTISAVAYLLAALKSLKEVRKS